MDMHVHGHHILACAVLLPRSMNGSFFLLTRHCLRHSLAAKHISKVKYATIII